MATFFENVRFGSYDKEGKLGDLVDVPHKLEIKEGSENFTINLFNGNTFIVWDRVTRSAAAILFSFEFLYFRPETASVSIANKDEKKNMSGSDTDSDLLNSDSGQEWSDIELSESDEDDHNTDDRGLMERCGSVKMTHGSYEDVDPGPVEKPAPFLPENPPGVKELVTDGMWTRSSCDQFISAADVRTQTLSISKDTDIARIGSSSLVITNDSSSVLLTFPSIHVMRAFRDKVKKLREGLKSVFTERTDEASAVQYFQFYGYLSQQQNMMQDYIRTSTYQRAMLANLTDFQDKIVLDVGAGSGILSFFAIQAGAKKVYAIEASSMAQHCETLVRQNNLSDRIIVIPGKVEEVDVPEKVDTIISEPMGYMLFNERMLESYLHAKKWLKQDGRMFPTQGDLHIAPFTDEALYMEQYQKANFWYQESFHGVNLTSLRNAAVLEYFKQPIVDTFDMRICLAKSNKYVIDFQSADETDLHVMEIPLTFSMMQSGMVHGLAFWFDCGFLGSDYSVWLSTAPTEPLTHWYQVRCLVQNPVLVKQGQTLTGKVKLSCNTRQSYDVDIELNIPGTTSKSVNCLDLKNPFFRYTGTAPAPPPGSNQQSATDSYWNNLLASGDAVQQQQTYVNGFINGIVDVGQVLVQQQPQAVQQQQQGIMQGNLIAMSQAAPINPGSIPSVGSLSSNANAHRTSIGAGLSPISFSSSQNIISGGTNHYPVSNQFMIGDYVMPGNLVVQSPKSDSA